MTAPTPIHRDPEADGNDYGCFTDEGNDQVAGLVVSVTEWIKDGTLTDWPSVVHKVREGLTELHASDVFDCSGCLDTVVKENVFHALWPALQKADIEVTDEDWMLVYGW